MSAYFWVFIGALNNALAVCLGAFGTHFLKSRLLPSQMLTYEIALRYWFIHASALIALGLVVAYMPAAKMLSQAGWFFVAGIIIFCGSLLLLIATNLGFFGALTPLGGLCFILGWLLMAFHALSFMRRSQ